MRTPPEQYMRKFAYAGISKFSMNNSLYYRESYQQHESTKSSKLPTEDIFTTEVTFNNEWYCIGFKINESYLYHKKMNIFDYETIMNIFYFLFI